MLTNVFCNEDHQTSNSYLQITLKPDYSLGSYIQE